MNHDITFQRDCHAFVVALLGTDSDNAAAYKACGECGRKWGHLAPRDQLTRVWCSFCFATDPVDVEPIRPEWWETKPPNYVDPFEIAHEDDDEEEEKYTENQIGEMVHLAASKLRDKAGAKLLGKTHIAKAVKKVQSALAREGIHRRGEDLRKFRVLYSNRLTARRKYYQKKKKQEGHK